MKIRRDFVSNSSTTIFTIKLGGAVTEERVRKQVEELCEFYRKCMTHDNILPQRLEETKSWGDLSDFPVKVFNQYDEYVKYKETCDAARAEYEKMLAEGVADADMPFNVRIWGRESFQPDELTEAEIAERKNTVVVEVPLNYDHIVDYVRTFLFNMFGADEDEVG